MEKSKGHICFDEKFEYFMWDGEVYRSPIECPIRRDYPVRNGARWFARSIESAKRLIEQQIRMEMRDYMAQGYE